MFQGMKERYGKGESDCILTLSLPGVVAKRDSKEQTRASVRRVNEPQQFPPGHRSCQSPRRLVPLPKSGEWPLMRGEKRLDGTQIIAVLWKIQTQAFLIKTSERKNGSAFWGQTVLASRLCLSFSTRAQRQKGGIAAPTRQTQLLRRAANRRFSAFTVFPGSLRKRCWNAIWWDSARRGIRIAPDARPERNED